MTLKHKTKLQDMLTVAHHDYEKGLHARAYFKVSNRAMGKDLVQDTFMKTWVYLLRGGKIKMMEAFLYHILNNLIVDEYRKHKVTSLDVLLEKGFEPGADDPETKFDILDGEAISLLMKRLPKKYKNIIQMRYMRDLSLKEISQLTGQSKNTIAVQVHRGLEKLRLLYSPV